MMLELSNLGLYSSLVGLMKENGPLFYSHRSEYFLDCPFVVGYFGLDCGSTAKRLVNPAEVVMHIVNR